MKDASAERLARIAERKNEAIAKRDALRAELKLVQLTVELLSDAYAIAYGIAMDESGAEE